MRAQYRYFRVKIFEKKILPFTLSMHAITLQKIEIQFESKYRVGQIKRGHAFLLITSEVLLGSSLFLAENKAS